MDCKTAQSMVTPYIRRELDDRELEEFLEHIGECRECHEELEIYFTIHFALQKLDEDKNISYNIQQMLKDDLEASSWRIRRRKLLRFWSYGIMLVAEVLLTVVLLTQIELWDRGAIEDTLVYQLMYGEEIQEETTPQTPLTTESQTIAPEPGKKEGPASELPEETQTGPLLPRDRVEKGQFEIPDEKIRDRIE